MTATKPRKKSPKDPICSLLRYLISPYGFGWEKPGGVDRYTNEQLIRWYNSHGFMGSPNNGDLYAHFAGQTTLYFWADGRKSSPRTLSLIDIDCHERGNARSASAFAEWLTEYGFPNLYHEPSTHGKGRHGSFVLSKEGCNDRAVCQILKRLDKVLKKLLQVFLATHPEHEVENVEIKGTPHLITWAKGDRPQIEFMKSGELAKLPRDILDRFDEFKDTTVLTIQDIYDLEKKADRMVIPAPRKLSVFKRKGSTANHPLAQDEVEAIGGAYLDFARTWVTASVGTSSRAKVVAEDVAIGLAIVKYCTRNMNADGTMPTGRIKAIWDGLLKGEVIKRAFDFHRWRVVRDLMETQGGLEMVDRRFYTGFVNEKGHEIQGRAAKWSMAQWLVEKLDQVAECGYLDDQAEDSLPLEDRERALLEQEIQTDRDQAEVCDSSPLEGRERALLEQERSDNPLIRLSRHGKMGALLEQRHVEDEDYGFDDNWIVAFRRDYQQIIGLIWGGSIEDVWREAG